MYVFDLYDATYSCMYLHEYVYTRIRVIVEFNITVCRTSSRCLTFATHAESEVKTFVLQDKNSSSSPWKKVNREKCPVNENGYKLIRMVIAESKFLTF